MVGPFKLSQLLLIGFPPDAIHSTMDSPKTSRNVRGLNSVVNMSFCYQISATMVLITFCTGRLLGNNVIGIV